MAPYKNWRSFEEARAFVRSLGLSSTAEWEAYCRSGKRPPDIPSAPRNVYQSEWINWGDFLGTGNVQPALQKFNFKPFLEAREFVRSLGFSGEAQWREYCQAGLRPADIPVAPERFYKDEWRTWGDYLGYKGSWTRGALLALLEDLRKQLPYLEERELYAILQQGGAMPALRKAFGGASPLAVLRDIRENESGDLQVALQDDALNTVPQVELQDETITAAEMPDEELNFKEEPHADFSTGELPTLALKDTLHAVDGLADQGYGLDDDVAQYLVDNRVALLWERYINEGAATVADALAEQGGHYFALIRSRFSAELEGVQSLKVPDEWSFTVKDEHGREESQQPNPMQKRTAWAVLNKRRVGNWSGAGAGKTLSAVLASRVADSRSNLVITNNATVMGWCNQITAAFPDSVIATEPAAPVAGRFNYIVLNYEKFQQQNRNALVHKLADIGVDFVVFDEVQFVKQRDQNASRRRKALEALVSALAERNPGLRVLGMSATPVINNLLEARKLLEIVTGRNHADLATQATVNNALAVHRALMINGFRYRPQYELEIKPIPLEVNGNALLTELMNARGVLHLEQALLPTKLVAITPYIRKGTLVYTHFVDGMVGPIRAHLEQLGFSVGLYTGDDKSGLEPFKAGNVEVLIGSKPVGTGIDGLQTVCDRLVMLSLPWTSAEYEQIIGRIRRQGSAFGSVSEIVPQVVLDLEGDQWSWDKGRMATIQFKRTLSDCAVDGNIPQTIRISEKELLDRSRQALERWIERVEDKGLLVIDREKLTIPLPPDIREKIRVHRGDFTEINNRWATSNSDTTHKRLEEDPSEWYLYHHLYREAREGWPEVPAELIATHLRARPDLKVGDFGCGECLLRDALPDHEVISLDHVAIDDSVTSCDIAHTPLDDGSLGAAVFSLSLMGKNWSDYLQEAHRTLQPFGLLFIAEPVKRWGEGKLEQAVNEHGFTRMFSYQRGDFRYIGAIKAE